MTNSSTKFDTWKNERFTKCPLTTNSTNSKLQHRTILFYCHQALSNTNLTILNFQRKRFQFFPLNSRLNIGFSTTDFIMLSYHHSPPPMPSGSLSWKCAGFLRRDFFLFVHFVVVFCFVLLLHLLGRLWDSVTWFLYMTYCYQFVYL